jgi:hypothetical protein
MDVRIVEHVQNAVFITFVQWFIQHPKLNGFGQIHTEPNPWCLAYFKFRFLKRPLYARNHPAVLAIENGVLRLAATEGTHVRLRYASSWRQND